MVVMTVLVYVDIVYPFLQTVKPCTIKTVGIVGAGLMGGGIGMCCANGYDGAFIRILEIDLFSRCTRECFYFLCKSLFSISIARHSANAQK